MVSSSTFGCVALVSSMKATEGAPPYGSKPYPVRVTGVPPIRGPKAGEMVEKRMRLTL